jgi:hypothetical protein
MSTYFVLVTGRDRFFMKSSCCCRGVRFDVGICGRLA